MACRQINLIYCAECRQIDKANISNCRWLQFNFCRLSCLKDFYAKMLDKCDQCAENLDHNNRVHVRDDVSKNSENTYTFICDQCFDRRFALAVHCHYCASVCYKGFTAQLITISGLIMKYRCSNDCQPKVLQHEELTTCSDCNSLSKCEHINFNGQWLAICSVVCLENFAKQNKISIGLFLFSSKLNFLFL